MFKLEGNDLCDCDFVVMEGRNHPKAHYYLTDEGCTELKDTNGIIKGVAKSLNEVNGDLSLVIETSLMLPFAYQQE